MTNATGRLAGNMKKFGMKNTKKVANLITKGLNDHQVSYRMSLILSPYKLTTFEQRLLKNGSYKYSADPIKEYSAEVRYCINNINREY